MDAGNGVWHAKPWLQRAATLDERLFSMDAQTGDLQQGKQEKRRKRAGPSAAYARSPPARPTVVYDAYWRFAAERHRVFSGRLEGDDPPFTDDPVLAQYKFTNAYRASDRVSQYLIQHVLYEGDPTPDEVFFRTLLFKVFNRIETWELLTQQLVSICHADYDYTRHDEVLPRSITRGDPLFSAPDFTPSWPGDVPDL